MGRDPEQPGGGGGGGQREQEGQHQHGHREGEGERLGVLQGGEQVSQSAVSPREGQAHQERGRQDPVLGKPSYVMFTCRHAHCRT